MPTIRLRATVASALCMTLAAGPVAADVAANTAYIKGLDYDLRTLLSVDLSPQQQQLEPGRESGGGKVVVCTKRDRTAENALSSAAILDPGQGVVWPGAILKLDGDLAEGRPTPYDIPRGPMRVSVNLPGIGDAGIVSIETPTNLTVPAAINAAVKSWLDGPNAEGYRPTLRAYSEAQKSYNKSQIGVELGFGAQWSENSVTANLSVESNQETTNTYQVFKQVYYTAVMEEPPQAGSAFAASTVLNGANMPADHPPGYIRSVDYGRIIIVQMTTNSFQLQQDAEAALSYLTSGGVQLSGELKQKYENISRNSTFKVFAIGGGVSSGAELVDLFTGDATKLKDQIAAGMVFGKANPGVPIAYNVADLQSRRLATMKTTTSYVEQTCETFENRSVRLFHRGGYAARFTATWTEQMYDKANDMMIPLPKVYTSGTVLNPWDHELFFPGDAKDLNISVENDTWVAWDPHRYQKWSFPVILPDKCLAVGGTTLNMTKYEC